MTEQLQQGIDYKININPFQLSGVLYPLVDNEHGSVREDRAAIPESKIYTNPVRIAKTKGSVKNTNDNTTPPVYEETYFMVSDHNTLVDVRLEFNYNDMKFKVMKREPLAKLGIIGYQYELDDITEELTI